MGYIEQDAANKLFAKLLKSEEISGGFKKHIIGELKKRYFDYTASGLACEVVEDRMRMVLHTYANTHSKEATLAAKTSEHYAAAKEKLKECLGLTNEFAVLPCGNGATAAIKKFQEIIGIYIPPATKKRFAFMPSSELPLVVVGPYEHHSNEVSYREAACETIRVGLNSKGHVDLAYLEEILKANGSREIIGSFCIASNVTGMITPYKNISKILRKYNAVVCFDAAASSPYMNIDCSLYDVMFVSPHKLLGGPGSSGLLIIKKTLIDTTIPPTFAGGGTVAYVGPNAQEYLHDIEAREDAGTPGILQLIRASLAYQLRNEVGLGWIKQHKEFLRQQLLKKLNTIDRCKIYGDTDAENIGIVSFNIGGIDPYTLCEKLSYEYGLQTRAGCSCAGPYGHDLLDLREGFDKKLKPGWLRVSLHFSHTEENVDFLVDAIKNIVGSMNS